MQMYSYPSLDAVKTKFVGTIMNGKMTDDQWQKEIRISSIRSKLNHANYHFERFTANYHYDSFREESGHEVLRAEFSAFVSALLGAIELLSHEVNILFRLAIKERHVKSKSVIQALRLNSPESGTLLKLEKLEGMNWYISLKEMRNKSVHNPTMIWTFHSGGNLSGLIFLPDDPFERDSNSTIEVKKYMSKLIEHTKRFIDDVQLSILDDLPS
ncbi:hypothetical protein J4772_29655 [Cohnella sp. LGH]|uniref:Cthe_2314 family HEPN domain-containing protein n=1 Tax=Cohnella sp. LGH TaxID=1619153 RepID=UPI001ADC73F5|nr:Cthe_2314 family HEPN domain-containing protein [Cohnella sp. LGH]QTH41655.1 hypothetical protein J4772_29655 [Cohnella sp. LGH]